MILLVGPDGGLLEGLAQMLGTAGVHVRTATDLAEADVVAAERPPLVLVVERSLGAAAQALLARLRPGGALIVYRTHGDPTPLLGASRRFVLAELHLPLERQRLLALVRSVIARARSTGRVSFDTPREHPAY